MTKECPGYALSNPTHSRSADLVYNFPTTAPMLVLMVDIYKVGSHQSFNGKTDHLIAACAMTGFACCESVTTATASSFAAAIMKIQLRYGIAHTLVVDKDSKFYGTFKDTTSLLKTNLHTLSDGNHDAMLVEQINRFLNKTLKIFCNERDFIQVAVEGILLSLYAWYSAPIPGTDISRSLVVIGQEFQFPIDFSTKKHLELSSSIKSVLVFANRHAQLLAASRKVAKVLIDEHRAYHREFINSQ